MAIDLERIMNRIMEMVENKQKNMPSGMQVYNDAQTRAKGDAIDKVNMHKDEMSVRDREINQRDRNSLLANPASSLDSSGRNAYANAALGKMNAEAQYNLGMAAHGFGSGRQAEATGNYQQSQADKQNVLLPVFERMSNQDQARVLFDRLPQSQNSTSSPANSEYNYFTAPQQSNSIAAPQQTSYVDNNSSISQVPDEREKFATMINSPNKLTLSEQLRGPVANKKPATWMDSYNRPKSTLGF